jgi:hypothetical protein
VSRRRQASQGAGAQDGPYESGSANCEGCLLSAGWVPCLAVDAAGGIGRAAKYPHNVRDGALWEVAIRGSQETLHESREYRDVIRLDRRQAATIDQLLTIQKSCSEAIAQSRVDVLLAMEAAETGAVPGPLMLLPLSLAWADLCSSPTTAALAIARPAKPLNCSMPGIARGTAPLMLPLALA